MSHDPRGRRSGEIGGRRRRGFRWGCALAGILVAGLLSGCAAVPWPHLRGALAPEARGADGWLDLRGVVHVHTDGSHDSPGTIEEVVHAAASAGVAWVAITEHPEPGVLPETGRIRGVTVIPGFELRAVGGSLLAIGVTGRPRERIRDPGKLVRWIHARGGVAFVAHMERARLAEYAAIPGEAPDGLEIANLHAVALQRRLWLAAGLPFLPSSVVLRTLLQTPAENLSRWETVPAVQGVVGGVDSHARFRLLGPLGGTVDRYSDMFRLLTTHVIARGTGIPAILDALRAGRSYVAWEGLAPVQRFRFEPHDAGYRIEAPREARLVLVCDGLEIAAEYGVLAELAAPPEARRCRGEAWLGKRLWVVTSYRRHEPAPPLTAGTDRAARTP